VIWKQGGDVPIGSHAQESDIEPAIKIILKCLSDAAFRGLRGLAVEPKR
jgi:hypothetical protein